MTRQRAFEASHRYWVDGWPADRNQRAFGLTTSPYGHGHNYVAWATVEGPVDPLAGMLLNLVELDALLKAVTDQLDHRFLNVDCAELLRGRQPTTETLALLVWERLSARVAHLSPVDARLAVVRVAETPELWAEAESELLPMLRLTRAYTFSAAHRLARADLDEAENRRLYGKCANPHGHGHDYRIEVSVRGEPDATTGMVIDLVELDDAVRQEILDPWDHRHLNVEVPPFDRLVPTSENVLAVAWERLSPRLGERLEKLTLHETPRGSFEYWGPSAPVDQQRPRG